jgi:electron transfer flavoprotein alpha subunit
VVAPVVAVVVERGGRTTARELLGEAAVLAASAAGRVVAVGPDPGDARELAGWGADEVVAVTGTEVEEDVAAALARAWAADPPWAVLVPGTSWGREVAGRVAARLGAGLTGDAVGLGILDDRVTWVKPAFGGQLVVEVTAAGLPQMGTVRPGILPRRRPRPVPGAVPQGTLAGSRAGRVVVTEDIRDDEAAVLAAARAVVVVGQGVDPADYPDLDPLLHRLGAVLGATRKVTDRGWLPRSRQIGITGHSVAPALLVLVGVGGSVNHMVSDVGLVGDWRQVMPALVDALDAARIGPAQPAGPSPSSSSSSTSERGTPSR